MTYSSHPVRSNLHRYGLQVISCALMLSAATLPAQVGNDNPTGPAGAFNGNITTAGSYDPMTGNATRSITDLAVAGTVGSYPLAFSRVANSRFQQAGDFGFGQAGGWRHSYAWEIDGSEESSSSPSFSPTVYPVSFPDGRVVFFTASSSNPYFRGPPGVRERFQPLNPSTLLAYLVLPDGGKVEFKATRSIVCDFELNPPCGYSYSYRAQALIDPYGLRTTLSYNTNGSLNTVQEPGGRWLQLVYVTTPWINSNGAQDQVIDRVQASDGQVVQYNYGQASYAPESATYTYLGNAVYPYDSALNFSPTASYAYQVPNGPNPNGYPLLQSCDDPMFAGAMKKIAYTYATSNGDPLVAVSVGQILSENNANTGQAVSTLYIPYLTWRNEIRGDGPSRHFEYAGQAGGPLLWRFTDFNQVMATQGYDANSFLNAATDRRGNTTNLAHDPLTGAVTQLQYPLTPNDTPAGTARGTITYTYGWASCPDPNNRDGNNPYYLYSVTDEAGNVTRFTRDSNKRVTQIDYPDNAFETFSYNSFGQVVSHQLTTGGVETFTYDLGTHLIQTYRDPYHAAGNPTARYQYDALSRLSGVTTALGSGFGDPNYTVNYAYNPRGQLTLTTLPCDPINGPRHTMQNGYNANCDGTLVSATDPLGHITSYTYDDYKRIRSVTTPQRFAGDTTPRTTWLSYDANQGTGDDYTHTDANTTRLTLPSGKLARTSYDPNLRKSFVTASAADGVTDASTTGFIYDDAGNLTIVKRPDPASGQASASRAANFIYDERNRIYSTTDAINPATTRTYDAGGRLSSEQRPNGQTITYDSYDAMNRVLQQTVGQYPSPNAVTINTYWPSGLLHTMRDPNQNVYTYEYDLMGRKTSVTYPPDSGNVTRSDSYTYDVVTGSLATHTNRAGNSQTFSFDNLNARPISSGTIILLRGKTRFTTLLRAPRKSLTRLRRSILAISTTIY
jgi:YD repeat-containing protein